MPTNQILHTLKRNYKQSPSDHNATHLNQVNYETNLVNNFVRTSNPSIYRHIRIFIKSATIPPTVYFDDALASMTFPELNQHFHSVFTQPSSFIDCINTNTLSSETGTLIFRKYFLL